MTKIAKNELAESIVNYILASPLNIESIPDDLEREMYLTILSIIDHSVTRTCFERLIDRVKSLCGKRKEE